MIQNEPDLYPYSIADFSSRDALVIAPHPDDESIGCGGSIVKHVAAGSRIKVVFLTDGELGDFESRYGEGYRALRRRSTQEALGMLGVSDYEFWGYPDRNLSSSEDLVGERLLGTIESFAPSLVYATSPFEAHPDHRASFNALWKMRNRLAVPILLYEVLIALYPNVLVDISREMEQKLGAIRRYNTELRYNDYIGKVQGLNRFRTATLPGDIQYAEAFIRLETRGHSTEQPCGGLSYKLLTAAWDYCR
jgi:LmbE family N-acetylglucosaminyl deacetylase